MKTKTPLVHVWPAGLLACGLLLAGCATPEARIQRSPELFSTLSAADQQTIREGRVSIGFTPEMTRLALGDPHRIVTKTDSSGTKEIWRYTTYETDDGLFLFSGYYHRFHSFHDPLFPYYLNYSARRSRDYLRITFAEGRVSTIEQEK
jgi:hypothetical protein